MELDTFSRAVIDVDEVGLQPRRDLGLRLHGS